MSIYTIVNEKTKTMPFYISSIGTDSFQHPCKRDKGFHCHHLLTVTEGSGFVECNGHTEKVSKGDIFFIKKNVPHSYYAVGDKFSTQWITFDGTASECVFNAYGISGFILFKDINLEKLTSSFDFLYKKASQNLNDFELSSYLYAYITTFFNCKKTSKTSKALELAIKYIKENHQNCITLDELASICQMNKFTFCREFKNNFSTTPFDYILHTRIQYAKKLLTDSELKVQEISRITGFNDTGYFCRIFKRLENCTPSEFKETIKKTFNEIVNS